VEIVSSTATGTSGSFKTSTVTMAESLSPNEEVIVYSKVSSPKKFVDPRYSASFAALKVTTPLD
jgi:hypothetical protein